MRRRGSGTDSRRSPQPIRVSGLVVCNGVVPGGLLLRAQCPYLLVILLSVLCCVCVVWCVCVQGRT